MEFDMNIILKQKIMSEIDKFLDKTINEEVVDKSTGIKKSVSYKTFNSSNVLTDKQYLRKLLYNIYKEMLKFGDKKLMTKNFIETLNQINAIRIDLTDDNIQSTTLYEDFEEIKASIVRSKIKKLEELKQQVEIKKETLLSQTITETEKQTTLLEIQNIQNEITTIQNDNLIKDGVSTPHNNLILPELGEELSTNNPNKEGSHTFIHEFIHALTRKNKQIGIQQNQRGIWDDLNEGFTECFAQIFITDFKFPNSNRRYVLRTDLVKDIINLFPKGKIEELYLSGQCDKIIELFKNTYNSNNETLFDYFNNIQKEAIDYAKQNNITDRTSVIAGGSDKLSEDTKNRISDDLTSFTYQQSINTTP